MLCKPVADSIKPSEQSGRVFRSTSLTQRDRLIPEMACSTRTRMRDRDRLWRFSAGVSSFPRGFFLVDMCVAREAHILETLYPYEPPICEDS